ncbi:MAG: hypothetical protein H6558_08400 [Lewinellaceae bacterium]|nr:hypothetical protein [Lewinellaceae bacterium]
MIQFEMKTHWQGGVKPGPSVVEASEAEAKDTGRDIATLLARPAGHTGTAGRHFSNRKPIKR